MSIIKFTVAIICLCLNWISNATARQVNMPNSERIVLGHPLEDKIFLLKVYVEEAVRKKGYNLNILPWLGAPENIHGVTRFVNRKTLEIRVVQDLSDELFNLTLAEELIHTWQNSEDFPKIRPRKTVDNPQRRDFANEISTRIMDIHAHRELRSRGISTSALGMETFENDQRGFLQTRPAPAIDALVGVGKLSNALLFVRLYFELQQDPEISPELWKQVETWFNENLPRTRELGSQIVNAMEEEGLDDQASLKRIFSRIMGPFAFKQEFEMFAGPADNPSYIELFQ